MPITTATSREVISSMAERTRGRRRSSGSEGDYPAEEGTLFIERGCSLPASRRGEGISMPATSSMRSTGRGERSRAIRQTVRARKARSFSMRSHAAGAVELEEGLPARNPQRLTCIAEEAIGDAEHETRAWRWTRAANASGGCGVLRHSLPPPLLADVG